jgi:DNA-binding response OmpR family regulator
MCNPIDVLLIDPSHSDARRTLAAIRRKAPRLSTVHLLDGDAALTLIFDYWPLEIPYVPRLIILDLPATGQRGKAVLHQLAINTATRAVPTVVFSARRSAADILQGFMLGARMNVLKPSGADEYGMEIERVVTQWLVN